MRSKLFYPLAAFAAGALASPAVGIAAPQKVQGDSQTSRKNILMIAVDDLKPLLGCYGDSIAKTPNLDRLAASATVFNAAFCQQAISAATRASLLTGWCPDRTRVWDLKTLIRDCNPEVVTLPQHFIANGYTVAGIGKIYDPRSVDKNQDKASWSLPYLNFQEFYNPDYEEPVMSFYQNPEVRRRYEEALSEAQERGISSHKERTEFIRTRVKPSVESADVPDDAYSDGAIAAGAVHFLEEYKDSKPYFLAVGFKKPHLPFCAPEKYWKLYNREDMPLASWRKPSENGPLLAYHNSGELRSYTDIPDLVSFTDVGTVDLPDEKARELIHGYYAAVSYMDAQVGKVLDALEKRGDLQETIIVFWGDHGWHLGDHGLWNKHTNFEQAVRVPYMIVNPGSSARKIDEPVEFLSIFPTLCELAGVAAPQQLDGESVAGFVCKGKANIKPYAVSQFPRGKVMGYSLRSERYRYTVWVDWKGKKTEFNNVVAEELYDLVSDPDETCCVTENPAYRKALKKMRKYWKDFQSSRGRANVKN